VTRTSPQCGDAADAVPNNVYGWGRLDALASAHAALVGTGTLAGTVVAGSGHGLLDATLRISQDVTRTWTTASGGSGTFLVRPLSGTYTLTATRGGYRQAVLTGVVVSAGLTTTLDITLTASNRVHLPLYMHTATQ